MNNARPVLKGLFILAAVILGMAAFGVYMAGVADRTEQIGASVGENFLLNAFRQAAAIVIFYLMGWLLLWPYKNRLGETQVYLLSFLVGLLAFEMISSFLIIFIIRYTYLAVMAVYAGVLVLIYSRTAFKGQTDTLWFRKNEGWTFVFWLAGTTALAAVLSYVPINVLSFDSVEYMSLGKMYASQGYIRDYYIYQISGHPFIPTLINSIAAFFAFDYAYALQNAFLVMCTLLFGWLIKAEIKRQGFKEKTAVWLSVLVTGVLAVNFFYLFLGVCLVPNIFAAYTLFFAAAYMYRYNQDEKTEDIILSFIFMAAFCFSRVEGPLIAAVILAYFAHTRLKTRSLLIYTGGIFTVVALWYISFYLQSPPEFDGQFLTVERSVMVVAAFLVIALYIFIKERFFSRFNRLLFWLFIGALTAGALVLSVLDIDKFIGNLSAMYQNMFFYGFWKITWISFAGFGIAALLLSRKREMFLEWLIPILLLLLLILFAYRSTPLHIYWSDSGNRMLLHIYPFCVYSLTLNILSAFAPEKKRE